MKLILKSDDFGLTFGICDAIVDCYLQGCTTSTSIIVNGSAYPYALKLLRNKLKTISLGLHVNLTNGPTFSKVLADPSGHYRFKFSDYLINLIKPNEKLLSAIEEDIKLQFKKAILEDHLNFDHVDGHDHIHMIPPIFKIICRECKKYGIKYIRFTREPYYLTPSLLQNLMPLKNKNIFKLMILNKCANIDHKILRDYNLKTTQTYYGVLHSNNMNYLTLTTAIQNAKKSGLETVEITLHPAYINNKRDANYHNKTVAWFTNLPQREKESLLLTSSRLKQFIQQEKIVLSGFQGL